MKERVITLILIFLNKLQQILEFFTNKTSNINKVYYPYYELRDIKFEIIKEYLKRINFEKLFRDHLFNYLFMYDPSIHKKASLIKYLLDNKIRSAKFSEPFLSKNDELLFKKYNLNVEIKKVINLDIVSIKILQWLVNKIMFIHYYTKKIDIENISRFKSNTKYLKLIRTRYERTENIYSNNLNKSLDNTIIYIIPNLQKKRQQDYIKNLIKNKKDFFFYIPKINFKEILKIAIKIYFNSFPKELKLPLIKVFTERVEIDNILVYLKKKFPDLYEFYTSDEIFPSSVYLAQKLKDLKIKVINIAHGSGIFCPMVNYDEFYIVSKIQKNHYQGTSNFKFYTSRIHLEKIKSFPEREFAIIFIGQNILSSPMIKSPKIKSAYKEVINLLEKIAINYKFPVYAKYHPNSTVIDKILSDNIKIIKNIEDLPKDYNYLAITSGSTYVLELLSSMPFYLINPQNKLDLRYHFPDNELIYARNFQELKSRIDKFLKDQRYFREYWEKLYQIIK